MNMAARECGGRLELAMRALDLFVPYVVTKGVHQPAAVRMPAHWRLEAWNLHFVYTEGVLLFPTDQSLSCMLDAWGASHKKELSVSWEPGRPWQPPHIAAFNTRGAWIPLLDSIQPVSGSRSP